MLLVRGYVGSSWAKSTAYEIKIVYLLLFITILHIEFLIKLSLIFNF